MMVGSEVVYVYMYICIYVKTLKRSWSIKKIYICINVYYDLCMYKMRPSVREPQFNWKISRNSTRKIVRWSAAPCHD